MSSLSIKLASIAMMSMVLSQGNASRISQNNKRLVSEHGRVQTSEGTSHPVHILLTRHGISCANIVAYFKKGVAKYSHNLMKDPLLCTAGMKFANDAKAQVSLALASEEHGLPPPDAVLSSVLARAIETALLEYDANPVFVVPYIREHGSMKDNQWNDRESQVATLRRKYPQGWKVNFQYAESLGYGPAGDWPDFLHFLSKSFLPDLIHSSGKRDGEPIVLAVVSHSNFMNSGIIFDACKDLYPVNGGKPKSNNNQVVKLSYEFRSSTDSTAIDVTPQRTLLPVGKQNASGTPPCSAVVTGTSLYTESGATQPLCRRDIGEECMAQIKSEGKGSYPDLVEDAIQSKFDELEKVQGKLPGEKNAERQQEMQMKIATLSQELTAMRSEECWSGGLPDFTPP